MAEKNELKDRLKLLGKDLLDISEQEQNEFIDSLNLKLLSQIACYKHNNSPEVNQETLDFFLKKGRNKQEKSEKSQDSIFGHPIFDEFNPKTLPKVEKFCLSQVCLWGLSLEEQLHGPRTNKMSRVDKAWTTFFKKKVFYYISSQISLKETLQQLALLALRIMKVRKNSSKLFEVLEKILFRKLRQSLRETYSIVIKAKVLTRFVTSLKRILRKGLNEILLQIFDTSHYQKLKKFLNVVKNLRHKKMFSVFFFIHKLNAKKIVLTEKLKEFCYKILSRSINSVFFCIVKQKLLTYQKNLTLKLLSIQTRKILLSCFRRFQNCLNEKCQMVEKMNYKKQVCYLNLVQQFWIFRNYLMDKDKKMMIKRQCIAKISLMLKQLKYKAFWRLRTIVIYEYNIQLHSSVSKYITRIDRLQIPLKSNMKLTLKENVAYLVESYDKDNNKIEEFFTDKEFTEEIEYKIDFDSACTNHLDYKNLMFCYGEFFERDTREQFTQIDLSDSPKLENSIKNFSENLKIQGNLLEKEEIKSKESNLKSLKEKLNLDLSPTNLRSKTVEPSLTRNSRRNAEEPLLTSRTRRSNRDNLLKKILRWQKIRERQQIVHYFKLLQSFKINSRQPTMTFLKLINQYIEIYPKLCKSFLIRLKNKLKKFSKFKETSKSVLKKISKPGSDFSKVLSLDEQEIRSRASFGKTLNRIMINLLKHSAGFIFKSLNSLKKKHERISQHLLNITRKLNLVTLKAFYIWKSFFPHEKDHFERKRYCFHNDYILTDTNSEDSKDYDAINLQIANSVKAGFEKFIKNNENLAGAKKITEILNKLHVKTMNLHIFSVYFEWKKGKNLKLLLKKLISKYFFKIIIKDFSQTSTWLEDGFDSISWETMNTRYLKLIQKLQSLKNSQTRRTFLFMVNNEQVGKYARFAYLIGKIITAAPFKIWKNFRPSAKKQVQGIGSMKKGKQKLRSARQTSKTFYVHLKSLLSKQFRRIVDSVNKRINDLKIQKHSLISLAKIVRKNISVSLNQWKIFNAQKKQVEINKKQDIDEYPSNPTEVNKNSRKSFKNSKNHYQIIENSKKKIETIEYSDDFKEINENSEKHQEIIEDLKKHQEINEKPKKHQEINENLKKNQEKIENSKKHQEINENPKRHQEINENPKRHQEINENPKKKAKIFENQRKILAHLFSIFKKNLSLKLRSWKSAADFKALQKVKIQKTFSNILKIFHKFLKIQLLKLKSIPKPQKISQKLEKTSKTKKLRSGRNQAIASNKFKEVFSKFLRKILARWKNSYSKQRPSNSVIKHSLNTLRKNFAMHLKNIFQHWARQSKSRTFSNQKKSQTHELDNLRDYKEKNIKRVKNETLRIIRNKYLSKLKVSFIRWVNFMRLSKARLIVDKENKRKSSSKKTLGHLLVKAFGLKLFTSFHNWKKITELTKSLPKSKEVIEMVKFSFKSSNAKNFVLLISSWSKQKLIKAFKKFQLFSKIMKKDKANQGLKLKQILSRVISNRLIKPILLSGLGDEKLELTMNLVKRTMLLMYKSQLENFKTHSALTTTSKKLSEKTRLSIKQAFSIFNGYGKKMLQLSFHKLKNNTNNSKAKQLKIALNISKKLIQILCKSYLEKWKENSFKLHLDTIVSNKTHKEKVNNLRIVAKSFSERLSSTLQHWSRKTREISNLVTKRETALKLLKNRFYGNLSLRIATWGRKARDLSIKVHKRELRLEKILKSLVFPVLNVSFHVLTPATVPGKQPHMLVFILDNYTKSLLKKRFDTLKSCLFKKKVQINNNLWQMKLSKERIKIDKKCQNESQKGCSVNQLSLLMKKTSNELLFFAFDCFKAAMERFDSKPAEFQAGIKKVRLVYLAKLKRNFDKFYYQIKWVAEKAMVSYAKSISALIENFHKYDSRIKGNYFSIWKNHVKIRVFQQRLACMQIKRLRVIRPNEIALFRIMNAFKNWKLRPDDVEKYMKLQHELEITKLKAKAYETELMNLKKNRSFLYNGLRK